MLHSRYITAGPLAESIMPLAHRSTLRCCWGTVAIEPLMYSEMPTIGLQRRAIRKQTGAAKSAEIV